MVSKLFKKSKPVEFIPVTIGDIIARTSVNGKTHLLKVVGIDTTNNTLLTKINNDPSEQQIIISIEPPFERKMASLISRQPVGKGQEVTYTRIN